MTAAAEGNINDTVFVREFCHRVLPDLLTGAGLSDGDAHSVTVDVIRRARMLTALPADYFDVLVTPFIEEVTQHQPLSAPAWLRAAVVVAVRNSRLEDFHALGGPLRAADITAITKAATEPLAQLLKEPGTPLSNNTLAGLDTRYPRAWASLAALSDLMASHDDTEHAYSTPQAPVPGLPGSHERIHAEQATGVGPMGAGQSVVASGVDPRFDQALLAMMQQVRDGNAEVVPLSALNAAVSQQRQAIARTGLPPGPRSNRPDHQLPSQPGHGRRADPAAGQTRLLRPAAQHEATARPGPHARRLDQGAAQTVVGAPDALTSWPAHSSCSRHDRQGAA